MNGLELSKKYFEEFGRPMLERDFPQLLPYLAAGLVGSGSERYGFDDEISRDHDFEPCFCIFLPPEDVVDRRSAFLLERAYAKLPKEYMGFARQPVSPVGGSRSGVIRTSDFYSARVGSPNGELSAEAWLRLPDYALAEAVNGEVFFDNYGEFSKIREGLMNMPRDARLKRLAGNLLLMAQSGQYNFKRCLEHGEPEAAQLACGRFADAALKVIFLLENKYLPYYKWSFRALRELSSPAVSAEALYALLSGDNRNPAEAKRKTELIEQAAAAVAERLAGEGLSDAQGCDLERHAYSVNDRISDADIRNLHILYACD